MTIPYRGFILVLSSPSGCGKTTVAKKILEKNPNTIISISCTTRNPRDGEIDGQDYFFKKKEDFRNLISENHFLEWAEVFGNYYGTPKTFVDEQIANGKIIVFDIDWQGVIQLKETVPDDIVSIFMLPPSMKELRRRLESRNSDHPEEIEKRIQEAGSEIEKANEYQYIITNDNLDHTINTVQSIIDAEVCKRNSNNLFSEFKNSL